MFVKLGVLLPLFLGAAGEAASGLCRAQCPQRGADGEKIADPRSCSRYYVCSDPDGDGDLRRSNISIACEYGMFFNASASECAATPADGVDKWCSLCDPCEVLCSVNGSVVPDPYDCRGFYHCLEGEFDNPPHETCDEGQIFDYIAETCDDANSTRCFDECDPCQTTCIKEGRIPNPDDCRSYQYCEPPSGLATFHCGAGRYYNHVARVCEGELGEPCQPLCAAPDYPDDSGAAGAPSSRWGFSVILAIGYLCQDKYL